MEDDKQIQKNLFYAFAFLQNFENWVLIYFIFGGKNIHQTMFSIFYKILKTKTKNWRQQKIKRTLN